MNPKPLIFIVDDHQENIQLLARHLSEAGFAVSFATDGKTALERIAKVLPELVLLDIVMPGMDGFEICRRLKALPVTRSIPVIFLTARKKSLDDLADGFAAGGADYLTKPFHAPELIARVRTHAALRRAYTDIEESEARYRAVVEDQTELICRFQPDGALTFVNSAYARFFGRTEEELIGTRFFAFLPEEEQEREREHLASIGPENPVADLEHRVRGARDEVRWMHWTNRGFFDEGGETIGFQSVGRDVTDRIHAEEAYRALVDHSLQGMAIFQEGRCVFANPMASELTGYGADELTALSGEELRAVLHPENRDRVWRSLMESSDDNWVPRRFQTRLLLKDGGERWVDVQAAPVAYRGRPSVQVTAVDMTRIVELETLLGERSGFGRMIGRCPAMQRVYTLIEQLAPTDITVLITGETGTGKELVAEALHAESARSEGPLVRVNCPGLPENLIESELFGHVRGAFTGADRSRPGRFQMADGGTLFLDEIGEVPLVLQSKLLRVIENREVQRLGDTRVRRVDVRIIAATNAELERRVADGRFREDLFFRLKGARIHLPPLRERGEDVLEIFEAFKNRFCGRNRRSPVRIRHDVLPLLQQYPWPGNVRELKNAAETACSLCPDAVLTPNELPGEVPRASSSKRLPVSNPGDGEKAAEESKIRHALEVCRWHKSRTAQMLGFSRSTLYRKLAEHGIDRNSPPVS